MRVIYQWILRLHPPRFRDRFEDEMMLIFDDASSTRSGFSMTFDVLASLIRQRILRPHRPDTASREQSLVPASAGIPQFACLPDSSLRPVSVVAGGLLTVTFFVGIHFLSFYGGSAQENPWTNWNIARSVIQNGGQMGFLSSIIDVQPNPPNDSPARTPTRAEARFLEWIQIFNTGDERLMNAYYLMHTDYPDRPYSAERDVHAWSAMFKNSGPLKIRVLKQYGTYAITAICEDTLWVHWKISLAIDNQRTGHIVALHIEDVSANAARRD